MDNKIQNQINYWIDTFKDGIPILKLPTNYARPSVLTYNGDTVEFNLDKTIKNKLTKLSIKHNSTLFINLLSAFYVLLFKLKALWLSTPNPDFPGRLF